MMLRTFKAPHEELKDLAKGFKEVKKAEKPEKIGDVDCAVYSSDLTDEAMKNAPLGRMLGQFGGAATVTGSARVWVDGSGNVLVYEISTKAALEIQGNQIELRADPAERDHRGRQGQGRGPRGRPEAAGRAAGQIRGQDNPVIAMMGP